MLATRPYRNIAGDHLNQNLHHAQGQHPDLPDINLTDVRNILDYDLRYVSVRDLFEYVTEGDDERVTALYRLALLTGAVRLQDADPEKITGSTALKAWFAEQLSNAEVVSRLAEVAPAVLRRELAEPDEEKIMSLDDFGFPVILVRTAVQNWSTVAAG